MVIVGLTGGIGTGKSTVAKMLRRHGAIVLNADRIAHQLMRPGSPVCRQIVRAFGRRVLNANRTIHRAALAGRVFGDPLARRRLERIVHPEVKRHIMRRLRELARRHVKIVVLDVPLLIESGMHRHVDVVVVVKAPTAVVRRRLSARGMSADEAARRRQAQAPLSAKVALADAVVDNANGLAHTRRQVKILWNRLHTLPPRG